MTFCFARWRRHGADGYEPDLPDGAAFLLLAEPGKAARWGVFCVDSRLDDPALVSLGRVPTELEMLLHSGRQYPPALALAKDEMTRVFTGKRPSRKQFVTAYSADIRAHLRNQSHSRYRLAEAVVHDPGYLTAGEFYWALSYNPGLRTVRWVSDDYHIYHNPAKHFRLGRAALRDLIPPKAHQLR
jgi:hypothetical protein